jgi:hypothetical protein
MIAKTFVPENDPKSFAIMEITGLGARDAVSSYRLGKGLVTGSSRRAASFARAAAGR